MVPNSALQTRCGTRGIFVPVRGCGRLSATSGRISPYAVLSRQPKIVAMRTKL